jgi:hypothetical protein
MLISFHARQQMQRRGLTVGNINWCIAGNNYYIQPDGRRHYSRDYDAGQSEVHVITNGAGTVLVTCWIRGRADPGV